MLVGKFTVGSCSYYPAGVVADFISVIAQCGTVEVTADGRATLEGFVLPQDCSSTISPYSIAKDLSKNRSVIDNSWGGSWQVNGVPPDWPEATSIYLRRGCEQISLHGLKKF